MKVRTVTQPSDAKLDELSFSEEGLGAHFSREEELVDKQSR